MHIMSLCHWQDQKNQISFAAMPEKFICFDTSVELPVKDVDAYTFKKKVPLAADVGRCYISILLY